MSINSDFRDLLKILNDCGVRYLVAGGYAVMFYTEPRFTKDIDIWVEPTPDNAKKVWQALAEFGAPLEQVSLDDFCNKDLIYQIGVAPNRIDIMMDIPGVDFKQAWENKSESQYGDVSILIHGLDEVIKAKMNIFNIFTRQFRWFPIKTLQQHLCQPIIMLPQPCIEKEHLALIALFSIVIQHFQ